MTDLKKWLADNGFRLGNNSVADSMNEEKWYAYKHSVLPARRCECNDDKDGVQIVIYPWTSDIDGKKHSSTEIEVCGMANGQWWKLMAYSIRHDELPQKFEAIEKSLIAAWNALVEG